MALVTQRTIVLSTHLETELKDAGRLRTAMKVKRLFFVTVSSRSVNIGAKFIMAGKYHAVLKCTGVKISSEDSNQKPRSPTRPKSFAP